MKRTLRVLFTDFWRNFSPTDFWLHQMLADAFDVTFDEKDPELLIFCDYGLNHLNYNCHKVYYSHENKPANPRFCDYSFCFNGRGKNHQYFPNLVENEFFQQLRSNSFSQELKAIRESPKTKFCNFIYSNSKPKERIKFCQKLMAYKHVDCPGEVLNNQPSFDTNAHEYCAGGAADQKTHFLKGYKFTIAFENESAPNYTTEKIFHALVAGSIPIYWGNPCVARLFNPKSFINCHEFSSFHDVIDFVKSVDQNDELLSAYQQAPPILADSPLASLTTDFLRTRLREIATSAATSASISQSRIFPMRKLSHFVITKLYNRIVYSTQRFQEILTGTSSRIAHKQRLAGQVIKP